MNRIWCGMIFIGIIYSIFKGNLAIVTNGLIESAGEAVSLCISMAGIISMWIGLMEVAERSGLIKKMIRGMRPILNFLFPNIPEEHPAKHYIAINMISNILGLGWAATPAGLKAMEELKKLEEKRVYGKLDKASDEMCTFLIINISSLQLIPVNMIAYRSQYGSVNPTAVIGPGIIATLCSTLMAVVFCKVITRKRTIIMH